MSQDAAGRRRGNRDCGAASALRACTDAFPGSHLAWHEHPTHQTVAMNDFHGAWLVVAAAAGAVVATVARLLPREIDGIAIAVIAVVVLPPVILYADRRSGAAH
jgi:hypothetical protein